MSPCRVRVTRYVAGGMRYLLRLDLERIRLNLEDTARAPQTDDDVMRLLAGLGVWRQSDEWWGAA